MEMTTISQDSGQGPRSAATAVDCLEIMSFSITEKTVWTFVRAVDGSGNEGFGECSLEGRWEQLEARFPSVRSLVGGGEYTFEELSGLFEEPENQVQAAVISAVDQAVADLIAQAGGVPLGALLTGSPRKARIPLYANINRRTSQRSPDGFAASAQEAAGEGFKAVKIAPFDGLRPELCGSREGQALIFEGLDRVAATRAALPKDCALMIDCHWRLSTSAARSIVPDLSGLGVSWYECPLPETPENLNDIRGIRAAANASGMRLAGCENLAWRQGFAPFLEAGCYDVIMPDVKYAGGLSELMKIADLALQHGTSVSIHNPSGPVGHLVSVHVMSALETDELLEYQYDETDLFDGIVLGDLPARHGATCVPTVPGIGNAISSKPTGVLAR